MTTLKKCIVLDLDNTLWGGVVGEDGQDNLALALSAPGASFVAFQQALLDLYDRGVILAINSTNNPDDALGVIRTHPNMILKEPHFAAKRINWQDKIENMKELATELNIGLDSMVFLDDSPTNREAMRALLPEVETPELPIDPTQYVKFLHTLPYFASEALTDEDKMRGNLYVTERLRREAEKSFPDKNAFLASLGLELKVYEDNESSLARLSQLTEKTNQFNTNKQPFSESEIAAYVEHQEYSIFHAAVTDQFGDYGIVAFALVHKQDTEWKIESLLMSCRILGRGVEEAFVGAIGERARTYGVQKLSVVFKETEKNIPAREFVERVFSGGATSLDLLPSSSWVATSYA